MHVVPSLSVRSVLLATTRITSNKGFSFCRCSWDCLKSLSLTSSSWSYQSQTYKELSWIFLVRLNFYKSVKRWSLKLVPAFVLICHLNKIFKYTKILKLANVYRVSRESWDTVYVYIFETHEQEIPIQFLDFRNFWFLLIWLGIFECIIHFVYFLNTKLTFQCDKNIKNYRLRGWGSRVSDNFKELAKTLYKHVIRLYRRVDLHFRNLHS